MTNSLARELLLREASLGSCLVNHPGHMRMERLFLNQRAQCRIIAGDPVKNLEGVLGCRHRVLLLQTYAVLGRVQR